MRILVDWGTDHPYLRYALDSSVGPLRVLGADLGRKTLNERFCGCVGAEIEVVRRVRKAVRPAVICILRIYERGELQVVSI